MLAAMLLKAKLPRWYLQVDRSCEGIVGNLQALGADIERLHFPSC
jgi:hypothetical protein